MSGAHLDVDVLAFDLLRFLAMRCSDWQGPAKETIETLSKLLGNIAAKPDDAAVRRIKTHNAKVKRAIVDAPGAVDFLVRYCWFKQEHLVLDATPDSPALNELVLTCFAKDVSRLHAFVAAFSDVNVDDMSFTEAVKVSLPNGAELKGAFNEHETVAEVKSWIARNRNDGQNGLWPELAAAWDPSRVFSDEETVGEANLHKNKLIVKRTGDHGDKARALMEETEAKRRAEAALLREQQVAKARLAAMTKFSKRVEQADLRAKNVQRFKEDRDTAEERARRVVAAAATAASASEAGGAAQSPSAQQQPLLMRSVKPESSPSDRHKKE